VPDGDEVARVHLCTLLLDSTGVGMPRSFPVFPKCLKSSSGDLLTHRTYAGILRQDACRVDRAPRRHIVGAYVGTTGFCSSGAVSLAAGQHANSDQCLGTVIGGASWYAMCSGTRQPITSGVRVVPGGGERSLDDAIGSPGVMTL
jgi:hypothetical protein